MSSQGAFVIGGVFLLGTLVAIPNLGVAVKNAWGPAQIIEANFSTGFATLYLLVVSAAIFVCCLSILAATIRLVIVIIRAIYYLAVGRTKAFAPVIAPTGDDAPLVTSALDD